MHFGMGTWQWQSWRHCRSASKRLYVVWSAAAGSGDGVWSVAAGSDHMWDWRRGLVCCWVWVVIWFKTVGRAWTAQAPDRELKPPICRNPGSNRGPLDLQSNALPTELFRREIAWKRAHFCPPLSLTTDQGPWTIDHWPRTVDQRPATTNHGLRIIETDITTDCRPWSIVHGSSGGSSSFQRVEVGTR